MAIVMTEAGKDILLKKLAKDAADKNPFVRELDATYLRYDAIEIAPGEKLITIIYKWRGTEVYRIQENFIYGQGNSLLLNGVDGRMKVSLSA